MNNTVTVLVMRLQTRVRGSNVTKVTM